MSKSVKLTNGDYIDSEAVYDATLSKTQKQINGRVNFPAEMPSMSINYGFTDSRYFYIIFNLNSAQATGLSEGKAGFLLLFSPAGLSLSLKNAETKQWESGWMIKKDI